MVTNNQMIGASVKIKEFTCEKPYRQRDERSDIAKKVNEYYILPHVLPFYWTTHLTPIDNVLPSLSLRFFPKNALSSFSVRYVFLVFARILAFW